MAEVKVRVIAETRDADDKLKRMQELADALGKKQTTIKFSSKEVDGATAKLKLLKTEAAKIKMDSGVFDAYINGAISLDKALEGVQAETKKTSSAFSTLTQRFTAANLVSSAITFAISKLRQALREAVDEMKEMDKELTTIKMVSGATAQEINALRESAFAGAQEMGRSVTDYLSAAERFTRAGYRDNIEGLTKLSLMTQNVGGVTEETASKFLLAADAAWKFNGSEKELTAGLDAATAVADQHATDVEKIATAITVAGPAVAQTGEDYKTFIAMIGTVTAKTQRSGEEVARGLRTIAMRIRQVKGELEDGEVINAEDISKAAEALDSVGISVLDDNKRLRSTSDILGELAEKWDDLTDTSKYGIGAQERLIDALAGKLRGNVLVSLVENWDTYKQILDEIENSEGNAAKKNADYTESWAAATDNLSTAWTNLVSTMTGKGGVLKWATEELTASLDMVNGVTSVLKNWDAATAPTTWGRILDKLAEKPDRYKGIFGLDRAWGDIWREVSKVVAEAETQMASAGKTSDESSDKLKGFAAALDSISKSSNEAAKSGNALNEAFKSQKDAISAAAAAIKSEKDDAIKSVADIYKAMEEAAEKSYYGSTAYKQGIKLLFGAGRKEDIRKEAKDALDTYFKEIEEGDYSKAAANLWGKFAGEDGSILNAETGEVIAKMEKLGDAFKWTFDVGGDGVDAFLQDMQDATGLSTDFWASLLESLGMYSDELDTWSKEHKVTTEAELDKEKAESGADEWIKKLDSIPKEVVTTILTIYKTQGAGAAYDYYNQQGPRLPDGSYYSGNGGGNGGRAKGKRDNYSGIALVNDEFPADGSKPELIISKSQGRAYIANGGKPALVNLASDDIVLTAKETREAMGVPMFDTGKRMDEGAGRTPNGGGTTTTTPDNSADDNSEEQVNGRDRKKKKKTSDKDSWEELKKIVDYLLNQAQKELKSQLKVLDNQLEEMENERREQQESNKLEEKQLAVQQALEDLQKAQTERTVRYYNEQTGQWEWMADQGAIDKAQEAANNAQQDLDEYVDELDYNARRREIEEQKKKLQEQYDELVESWQNIIDVIEAPSGDLQQLLGALFGSTNSVFSGQAGSIGELLNALREGVFGAGYNAGLGNVNGNTPNSTTTTDTEFQTAKGGASVSETAKGIIADEITKDILNTSIGITAESMVDSLKHLVDGRDNQPSMQKLSKITNNNGGNFIINGVQIGADMAQRPFAEVMKTLAIHANENR